MKQFGATTSVTLLHFHPCESSFVSLHSLFVSTLTFRRLAHLRQFVTSQQSSKYQVRHVHRWSLVASEFLLLEVSNFCFSCSEKPIIMLACKEADDQWQHVRVQKRKFPNMCMGVFRQHCFCPSRNQSISIRHSIAIRVHRLVVLCSTKLCLQLGRIQTASAAFRKAARLTRSPQYERFTCFCSVTWLYAEGRRSVCMCL